VQGSSIGLADSSHDSDLPLHWPHDVGSGRRYCADRLLQIDPEQCQESAPILAGPTDSIQRHRYAQRVFATRVTEIKNCWMIEKLNLIENIDAPGTPKKSPSICSQRRENSRHRWICLGPVPDTRSFRHRRAPKDGRIANASGGIRSVTFARWAFVSSMLGGVAIADGNRRSISSTTLYQFIAG
jgi:hypothetical protein